jgi:hypothetical protein
MQAMQAGSGRREGGGSNVKMVRIAGPADLVNGAGQLLAAGTRHIQGVRSVLQVGRPPHSLQHCLLRRCALRPRLTLQSPLLRRT